MKVVECWKGIRNPPKQPEDDGFLILEYIDFGKMLRLTKRCHFDGKIGALVAGWV